MSKARNSMTQIEVIDSVLNEASDRKKRIFYFQCENREIIFKALNGSRELQKRTGLRSEYDKQAQAIPFYGYLKEKERISEWTGSKAEENIACWYIRDFQVHSEQEQALLIKNYLDSNRTKKSILLLSAPVAKLPVGFEDEIELIRIKPINQREIYGILKAHLQNSGAREALDDDALKAASAELLGFTEAQLSPLLKNAYAAHGGVDAFRGEGLGKLKKMVQAERKKLAEKDGTLSFDEEEPIAEGMTGYISWLRKRADIYRNGPEESRKYGLPPLKGVLITGVPGTGKTEMARRTARELDVPLVKFCLSALQSSKFGEAEANLMRYLDRLDSMGRCVMMIDEIEKYLGQDKKGEGMHEVKEAQLGLLLDWMQKNTDVFCFFTANRVEKLPPELIRDRRLSKRFYAFMPTADELMDILHSHMWRLHHESGNALYADDLLQKIGSDPYAAGNEQKMEKSKTLAAEVIKEVIRRAAEGRGKLNPFLTGANVGTLLEMVNVEMMEKNYPYGYEAYREKMIECFCSDEFVPYGESNPWDIARLWVYIRKNRYSCVSESAMLDPSERAFDDEKKEFGNSFKAKPDVSKMDYKEAYTAWFKYRMCPVIEKEAKKTGDS